MLGFSNMLTVLTLCFLFSIGATFSSANFESKLSIEDPFAWLTGKTNEVSGMSEKISSNEFASKDNSNFAEFNDAKGGVKKANSRRKRSHWPDISSTSLLKAPSRYLFDGHSRKRSSWPDVPPPLLIKAPSLYLFNGNPRSRYQRSGAANNFENEFGAAGRFFGGIVKSLLSEEKDESKKGKAKRKIDQNGSNRKSGEKNGKTSNVREKPTSWLPGIGPVYSARLEEAGYKTVGSLYKKYVQLGEYDFIEWLRGGDIRMRKDYAKKAANKIAEL